LHARLVIIISAALIVSGSGLLLIFGLTPSESSWTDKVLGALFQSVTARTAGFNTVDIGLLPSASLFTLIVLMFIGGSPGSCAGGIKTTSFAVWLARLKSSVRGEREVHLLDRRVSREQVNRADLILGLALSWNILGILVLLTSEAHLPVQALALIFEQISAFGTVGLSTGLTPDLSNTGKLWLSATMFVGRLGTLTIALWMFPQKRINISYAKGTVMIG
jgi:trk system potassium uptake protein TrkH